MSSCLTAIASRLGTDRLDAAQNAAVLIALLSVVSNPVKQLVKTCRETFNILGELLRGNMVMAKAPVQAVDLDQPDRRSLLDALDASLRENGVVLVRMTAVQRRVKDRALDAARAFFGLPREEKMAVQAPLHH